jgi:hypothetical protein
MEIRPVVKIIVKLLIITSVLYVIGLMTQIVLFSYAAVVTGVLMSLNMYWLGLCLIAYFIERDNQKLSVQEESDVQITKTPVRDSKSNIYIIIRNDELSGSSNANGKHAKHVNGNHN